MKQRFARGAATPRGAGDHPPSESMRLREVREWAKRLHVAQDTGYRLHDVSIATVSAHTDFLLSVIDRLRSK
jgi:hypothetical protein